MTLANNTPDPDEEELYDEEAILDSMFPDEDSREEDIGDYMESMDD